jgi:hypothetical protein
MKTALCLAVLSLGQLTVAAAETAQTAYEALRVIGKQDGEEVLNRVVEVRGRGGAPEPQVWKVVLNDPSARGGLREVDVQRGRIIGERTPVARSAGRPINFSQLNLDSEGAFTVANQEAQKIPVTFDRIDYTLQAGGKAPLWHLELFDAGNPVGTLDISADNGSIVRRELARHLPPRLPPVDDHAYLRRPPAAEEEPINPDDPDYVEPREYRDYRRDDYRREYREDYDDDYYSRRDGRSFPERVENHFERRAKQIKRFFFGY